MALAIATHVKLTETVRPGFSDAAALGHGSDGVIHSIARTLSFAEQRAMRGLERVRSADAVLGEVQRGLQRIHELLRAAERSDAPSAALSEELSTLVSGLGELLGVAEAHGVPLGEGAALAIEITTSPEHAEEPENLLVTLPDVAATLFGSNGLGDLDVTLGSMVIGARHDLDVKLQEVSDARTELAKTERRIEDVLRALGNARNPKRKASATSASTKGSNTTPMLAAGAVLHARAGILTAAERALKAQANPSPRAVMLLEKL